MQPPAPSDASAGQSAVRPASLILVGASVRAAAQSARRAAMSVVGIDSFGDTDTVDACDQCFRLDRMDSLPRLLSRLPKAHLMHVGGFENDLSLLQRLADRHTLLGPDPVLGNRLRKPAVLAQLARDSGLQFPETVPLTESQAEPVVGEDAAAEAVLSIDRGRRGRSGWLIKQIGQSGGLGVGWAHRSVDSVPLAQRADVAFPTVDGGDHSKRQAASDSEDARRYLQRWVAGRTFGVTFLSDGKVSAPLGVCRSHFTRIGARPFLYAGSSGPVALSDAAADSLSRLGRRLAEAGMCGLFGADIVVDRSDQIWLLEINPRWTGSSELIERWLGDRGLLGESGSLLKAAVAAAQRRFAWGSELPLGVTLGLRQPDASLAGPRYFKRIIYARHEITFSIERAKRSLARIGVGLPSLELCDLPPDGRRFARGEPLLTVIMKIDANSPHGESSRRLRRVIRALS